MAQSEKFWVLYFYASADTNCKFCKIAFGLLRHLSGSLRKVAGVAKVDCTRDAVFCREHSAQGTFPHIRLYRSGSANKGRGEALWPRAFSSTDEVHLSLQVVERVVRTSLGTVLKKNREVAKQDGEEEDEDVEEEEEEPEPQPDEPNDAFPDAPPASRGSVYVPSNYEAPPEMIGM